MEEIVKRKELKAPPRGKEIWTKQTNKNSWKKKITWEERGNP